MTHPSLQNLPGIGAPPPSAPAEPKPSERLAEFLAWVDQHPAAADFSTSLTPGPYGFRVTFIRDTLDDARSVAADIPWTAWDPFWDDDGAGEFENQDRLAVCGGRAWGAFVSVISRERVAW